MFYCSISDAISRIRSRDVIDKVPCKSARVIHSAALKQLLYFWPQVFGGRAPDLLTTKTGFITQAITRADLQGTLSITSRALLPASQR